MVIAVKHRMSAIYTNDYSESPSDSVSAVFQGLISDVGLLQTSSTPLKIYCRFESTQPKKLTEDMLSSSADDTGSGLGILWRNEKNTYHMH